MHVVKNVHIITTPDIAVAEGRRQDGHPRPRKAYEGDKREGEETCEIVDDMSFFTVGPR